MEVNEYIDHVNKAITLFKIGDTVESLAICQDLIKELPDRKGAYLLIAQIHVKKDELNAAETALKTGLSRSKDPVFHINLGIINSKMGRYKEALKWFSRPLDENDKNESFYIHYAKSLAATDQIHEGILQYKKCLQYKPGHKQALNNMANLLKTAGNYSDAIQYFKRLIKLYPEEAIAFNNLGSVYEKKNQINDAKECYEKSLKLDATLSITYFNYAQLIGGHFKDFKEALRLIETGLQKGDNSYKKGLRFYQIIYRQHIADWSGYQEDVVDLHGILEEYLSYDSTLPFDIVPYSLSHSKIENHLYRKVAEQYSKTIEKRVRLKYPDVSYNHSVSDGKIKIGYYSPNMRLHPGGLLVRKLFDYHDSTEFEIHAFSLVASDDFVHQEIEDSVDYFHDVSTLNTLEIADLINRTGIDILVSLAFYNISMNTEVLALRPAPLQMVLIGSHETTGASFIDYAFSDESMMDADIKKNFTESIITLPCSLLINSELPTDSSIHTTRKDHGLPDGSFIFASFNHPRKLDPDTVDSWMKILQGSKNSVLWLYDGGSDLVRRTIIEISITNNVSEQRIIFAPKVELKRHWERLRHADLFLDSFNYNAHVTGIEALRIGVPLLTLKGSNHNSRIGSSLVYYSGLSNCTFLTKNDYIVRSIQLASNLEEIESLKGCLQSESKKLIFDTELQVKYLEKAYQKALLKKVKNLPPKDFNVGSALSLNSLDRL